VIGYLIRRVGQAVGVVIGVMILTFILIHMEPGSAARSVLGIRSTASRVAIFNATYGLDQPLYKQFWSYVTQVAHGNLGTSYYLQQPVKTLFVTRLPRDFFLLGTSTVIALLISVPMGVLQAVKRNGLSDNLLTGTTFTLYTMPTFFFAMLMISLLSVQFHVFPPVAPQTTSLTGMLADPRALVLPEATLTLTSIAGFSRYMRSSVIDTLAQEYLRVCRAKGLRERLVLWRHVLRNSFLPIVTILGLSVPGLVGGAIIVEDIFSYQGMGSLFYQAALNHDFPIMLGATLLVGILTVIGNLAADIAYGILDPRVRHVDH
jgi:peptide/nickel transport system permease protein